MERGQFLGIETRTPDVKNPKAWFIVRHRGMPPGGNGLEPKENGESHFILDFYSPSWQALFLFRVNSLLFSTGPSLDTI